MLEEYQFGEKIDITLISATVYSVSDKGILVTLDDGEMVSIPASASRMVRRRVPADGVPLVDDLWADKNGERYFATRSGGQVAFIDGDNRFWDWERINVERGPLRLVFRQCSADPADAAAEVAEELAPADAQTLREFPCLPVYSSEQDGGPFCDNYLCKGKCGRPLLAHGRQVCPDFFDEDDDITRLSCVRDAGHDGLHWDRGHVHEWGEQ